MMDLRQQPWYFLMFGLAMITIVLILIKSPTFNFCEDHVDKDGIFILRECELNPISYVYYHHFYSADAIGRRYMASCEPCIDSKWAVWAAIGSADTFINEVHGLTCMRKWGCPL